MGLLNSSSATAVTRALMRRDLYWFVVRVFMTVDASQPFLPNWHIKLVCDWLMLTVNGNLNRFIVTLPPRNLKSICVSVALPAFILGQDPTARIICVSYSDDLARKFARDCRKVMESKWYRLLFPDTHLSKRRSATNDFETTRGGGRFTTSIGGALTGRGGGYIIIDDPIKPQDALSSAIRASTNQWYDNTLRSRLDNKSNGVVIIAMQRTHIDDLVGHVLEREHWDHISLPAIAERDEVFTIGDGTDVGRMMGEALHPERESLEVLEQTRAFMGEFAFQAQYQQNPVPEGGNLVKWDWFSFYDDAAQFDSQSGRVIQSWDTAISVNETADWSVCTTWIVRGDDYYLIDVFRARLDFPSLKRQIVAYKKAFRADTVLIEDAGAAQGLIQQLKGERMVRPIAIKPERSKADRLAAQSAVIEAGRVHLPRSAPWLDTFHAEMVAFPSGRHDDQVDSVSQFLGWVTRQRPSVTMLHVRA
jgi:predicted phage terminase large subunit-like protein